MQSLEKIKTRSITDPIFTISGFLFLLTGILVCCEVSTVFIVIFLCFSGLGFLAGLCVYLYYAIKNPDYIRSEYYQLQKQQLTMLGDSKNKGNANMNLLPIVKPSDDSTDGKTIKE